MRVRARARACAAPYILPACSALQMKLCVNTVISAPLWLEQSLAMNINFAFIASCPPSPPFPSTPHLTQRRISFRFVSAFIKKCCTSPSPSLPTSRTSPDSLRRIKVDTINMWGRCPRQQKSFLLPVIAGSCKHHQQQASVSS